MTKILVKKAVDVQYPVSGAPILVTGGGGGGRQGKGRTLRERIGSFAGGALGALGTLAGRHSSLGSMIQGGVSGAAQGRAIGGGLGRSIVGREGQARANIREQQKQAAADARAAAKQERENRGVGVTRFTRPISAYNKRRQAEENKRLAAATRRNEIAAASRASSEKAAGVLGRRKLRERTVEERAAARARGGELGAEQKEQLAMINRLQEQTGAPNLKQALAILGGAAAGGAGGGASSSTNVSATKPTAGNIGVTDPSEMSSTQEEAIRNTMARRNQSSPTEAQNQNRQLTFGQTFQNLGVDFDGNPLPASPPPETGNPLGTFDNPDMANSPLATQGLSAANMVAPPPTGAGAELTNVQTAANQMLSQEGMDDQRSTMDLEAAKNIMKPRDASVEFGNIDWSKYNKEGMSANQAAARQGEQQMDSIRASRFEDLFAPQTPQYDEYGFPVRTGEPMDLAFRLLKMMIFSR